MSHLTATLLPLLPIWRNRNNVCIFCRHIICLFIQHSKVLNHLEIFSAYWSLYHFILINRLFPLHILGSTESGEEGEGNQWHLQPSNALRLHCWNLAAKSVEIDSAIFHSAFCSSNLMMGIGLGCLPIPSLLNSTRNKNGISLLLFLSSLITFFSSGAI